MMKGCPKLILLLMIVMGVATCLFLLLPALDILEILLIAVGLLCIIWGVSRVNDQLHSHRVSQQEREIRLLRLRRQRLPYH
jgi:uncharacterized membrane protein